MDILSLLKIKACESKYGRMSWIYKNFFAWISLDLGVGQIA